MNHGHQLLGTHASIAESWGILLNHTEQLASVAHNHALHTVTNQLHGFVATLSELRHQRVGRVDHLAEVGAIHVADGTRLGGHGLGLLAMQSSGHARYLLLTCQLIVV